MKIIKTYDPSMQPALESCFEACMKGLGWGYQPDGRHADILDIENTYMRHGCFWCLFDSEKLIGMVAVRRIDEVNRIAELKRLYLLPEYQGKGYGNMLFRNALDYTKKQGYVIIRADTQRGRAASRHLMVKYRFRQIEKYNQNEFAELFYELDLTQYEPEENRLCPITYTNELTAEQFNELRLAVDWSPVELSLAKKGLENTAFLIVANDGNNPVGMARVITDYGYQVLIADVIVRPEYQSQGIGTEMMKRVMQYISDSVAPGQGKTVTLNAAKGREGFYKQFGFFERPTDKFGPGMTQWVSKEAVL